MSVPELRRKGSIGLALLGTVVWTVVANTARKSTAAAKAGHPLAGTAAQVKAAIYDAEGHVGAQDGSVAHVGVARIRAAPGPRTHSVAVSPQGDSELNRMRAVCARPPESVPDQDTGPPAKDSSLGYTLALPTATSHSAARVRRPGPRCCRYPPSSWS